MGLIVYGFTSLNVQGLFAGFGLRFQISGFRVHGLGSRPGLEGSISRVRGSSLGIQSIWELRHPRPCVFEQDLHTVAKE